jgi:hypothetical protein
LLVSDGQITVPPNSMIGCILREISVYIFHLIVKWKLALPFMLAPLMTVGRDSSVGIATRYGLDGPGIESRCGRDFPHPSKPALGPTPSPTQWGPGLFQG